MVAHTKRSRQRGLFEKSPAIFSIARDFEFRSKAFYRLCERPFSAARKFSLVVCSRQTVARMLFFQKRHATFFQKRFLKFSDFPRNHNEIYFSGKCNIKIGRIQNDTHKHF